jgi:hypothetical protein
MTWSRPPGLLDKPPSSKDDQKWSPATEISSDLLLFLITFTLGRGHERSERSNQTRIARRRVRRSEGTCLFVPE